MNYNPYKIEETKEYGIKPNMIIMIGTQLINFNYSKVNRKI